MPKLLRNMGKDFSFANDSHEILMLFTFQRLVQICISSRKNLVLEENGWFLVRFFCLESNPLEKQRELGALIREAELGWAVMLWACWLEDSCLICLFIYFYIFCFQGILCANLKSDLEVLKSGVFFKSV